MDQCYECIETCTLRPGQGFQSCAIVLGLKKVQNLRFVNEEKTVTVVKLKYIFRGLQIGSVNPLKSTSLYQFQLIKNTIPVNI